MQEQTTLSGQLTTIYCPCDDLLRAWGHADDPQATMTTAGAMITAGAMTTALAALFDGNQERSRCFLKGHGYIKRMLSRSRLNRRLYAAPESAWQPLSGSPADAHRQVGGSDAGEAPEYAVDSLPVPVCDNIRIRRCRLYPLREHGEASRRYAASKCERERVETVFSGIASALGRSARAVTPRGFEKVFLTVLAFTVRA